MSDNYLWDGSGEPDPETQELEQLLGQFRSTRPAPQVNLSKTQGVSRRQLASFACAAAAVIIAGVIGLSLWFALRSHEQPHDQRIAMEPLNSRPTPGEPTNKRTLAPDQSPRIMAAVTEDKRPKHANRRASFNLSPEEIREGRIAKAQLMLAMHITGEKLSIARKQMYEQNAPKS